MLPAVLVLFAVCWGAQPVQSDCGAVEEGQSTTLTCDVNTASCPASNIVLTWYAETAGSPFTRCFYNRCGGGIDMFFFSATISPTRSTLTLLAVNRTDPIHMETKWECEPCTGSADRVTACEKLQVYALPEDVECTLSEVPDFDNIESVTLSCSTSRVYPRAQCSFFTMNGRNIEEIDETPSYNHQETGESPVYYRSECWVSVPVGDLGEGTHSFTGFIYPDIIGGEYLIYGTPFDETVKLYPPLFKRRSVSESVYAGITHSLRWEVFAHPPVTDVYWLKDDVVLDTAASPGKYSGSNVSVPSLTIRNLDTSDAGVYACVVSNSLGAARGMHRLTVLAVAQASHTCSTNMVQGYFLDNPARCTCTLTSGGSSSDRAQWYKGDDVQTVGSDGALVVTYDENNPEQVFTCEVSTGLERRLGSTLTAKFACSCKKDV